MKIWYHTVFSSILLDDNEISDRAKTAKDPLGVEVLFGAFSKWGYQTLFQEDLCWYDYWGIGLTDLQVRGRPDGDSEFKDRYCTFVNILHKFREEGTNAMTTYERLPIVKLFSLLVCHDATKFLLLSVFTLTVTICPRICSKSRVEGYKESTFVAQKRRCLTP